MILNKEYSRYKENDSRTTKINSDLKIQVSELSQYDRIREKAENLGFELNEQNVKVVQE